MAKNKFLTLISSVLWLGLTSLSHCQCQAQLQRSGTLETAFVVFEQFGGFAGIYERYEIHEDGIVVNSEGSYRRIPFIQVDQLRRKTAGFQFPQSQEIPYLKFLCCDCVEYRITIRNRSGKMVLHLNELQLGNPNRVSDLANIIRDLLSRLQQ